MKAYIVVTHTFRPAQGSKTMVKGWQNQKDSMEMFENVEFLTRVKNKHLTTASTILDVSEGKVVKSNANEQDYNNLMNYIRDNYKGNYNEFLSACSSQGITVVKPEQKEIDISAM